jgi:hypothetical protein
LRTEKSIEGALDIPIACVQDSLDNTRIDGRESFPQRIL